MTTRQQRKAQTRSSLIEAALQLVEQGQGVADLSIREITKQAGVVPTSFYRHFKNVDELGLNIVDELGMALRRLIRSARQADISGGQMIRKSVQLYCDYLDQHYSLFLFMAQGRSGPSPAVRHAIRSELKFFSNELVADLQRLNVQPDLASQDLEMVADMAVSLVSNATVDLMDAGEPGSPLRLELEERLVKQLRLVFLGAGVWRSTPPG